MRTHPLKAHRKLTSSIGLLVVIVAVLSALTYYAYEKRYQGPLFKLTGAQSGEWISTAQKTVPKTHLALGVFPFNTKISRSRFNPLLYQTFRAD